MKTNKMSPQDQAQLNVSELKLKASIEGIQEAHRLFEEEVRGNKGKTEAQKDTWQLRFMHRMEDMKGHYLRQIREMDFRLGQSQAEVASLRKQLVKAKEAAKPTPSPEPRD